MNLIKGTEKVSAVIVAAGQGNRFGQDKIFFNLYGKPLIFRTLTAFEHSQVNEIVVVTRPEHIERMREMQTSITKLKNVVEGGEHRGDSVYQGLLVTNNEFILVHDAARPFVSPDLINRVIKELFKFASVVPCVNVSDTVRLIENGMLYNAIDREKIAIVQTPQGFHKDILLKAFALAMSHRQYFTDESTMVDKVLSMHSHVVMGDKDNKKITYREDIPMQANITTGIGYDIHKLKDMGKLIVGGVVVSNKIGVEAHSDGDALVHALIDAILGAFCMEDIGVLYPDTDMKYRGIKSTELLKDVMKKVENRGNILSIDCVVKLQHAKIAPYKKIIKDNLSKITKVPVDFISVKGKTGEGIGPVGEGKAIEAYCVVSAGRLDKA